MQATAYTNDHQTSFALVHVVPLLEVQTGWNKCTSEDGSLNQKGQVANTKLVVSARLSHRSSEGDVRYWRYQAKEMGRTYILTYKETNNKPVMLN